MHVCELSFRIIFYSPEQKTQKIHLIVKDYFLFSVFHNRKQDIFR